MNQQQIEAIKKRAAAATKGPWRDRIDENGDCWVVMDESHKIHYRNLEGTCHECHANADFIRCARQDVPDLLSEVSRLNGVNADLLTACTAAADLLARLWTSDAPTVNEVEAVKAKLETVMLRVNGQQTLPGLDV